MSDESITIIGAGIAGLAAAIALAQKGCAVAVFEQAAEFAQVGAGIQLGPNAIRALKVLDCWDACKSLAHFPDEIHMRDGLSGKLLRRVLLGKRFEQRYGEAYCVMHRADLHRILVQRAGQLTEVDIKLGVAASVDAFSGRIIAADGINSAARHSVFPGHSALTTALPIRRSLLPNVPALKNVAMENVNLWLMPNAHVVHYPAGHPQRLNIVSVSHSSVRCEAALALNSLLEVVPAWTSWPATHVPPLPRWHVGNLCLIGDAAHGTVPFLAQGAAMALEDAVALAAVWGEIDCFSRFESLRRARTARLDRQSRRMVATYHAGGLIRQARNAFLRVAPEAAMLRPLHWLYSE